MMTLQAIKKELRAGPYAWPGGYPRYFATCDGENLSFDAVRENWREIVGASLRHDAGSCWALLACDVNWEDADLVCAHTGERIESAYAEPEESRPADEKPEPPEQPEPYQRPDMDDLPHKFWNCETCGAQNSCLDGECQYCDGPEPKPSLYSVAVYLVDRAYGGPEEGGWWYDCGEIVDYCLDGIQPAELVRVFGGDQEAAAKAWRDELQARLDAGVNVGRRPVSSVLSDGKYAAILEDGLPPHHWPKVRPQYE